MAFGLRPLASWRAVHRLRTVGVGEVPESVRSILDRLVERMGIRQSIRLCQSTLVNSPAVVGCFRPMILLPIALLTGLSTWQVAAILAHELAHVARRDYLVNLLQTLVETLFFYHPAVWWLSRRIREERENCCDDLAVAVLGNRVGYCRAILAATEVRDFGTALAMGAQGGALGARFRRLLDGHQTARPGRFLMPAGAVAVAVLVGLAIGAGIRGQASLQAAQAAPRSARDEAPDAAEVKDQQDALAALRALGVSTYGAPPVSFPGNAGRPARKIALWNVRPEMASYLGRLTQIEELAFVVGDLRGEPSVQVGRLKNLRRLSVANAKLNPTDLVQFKDLVRLEGLDAMFTVFQESDTWRKVQVGQLTPAEREWVSRFFSSHPMADPTRSRTMIEAAVLTDRALERLGGLTRLRVLRLRNTHVTERSLELLKDLPALEELDLNLLAFPPQAARIVGGLRSLRRFRYADVTDAELTEIARLSNLEELEVWAGGVTDRGAESLARLTALRRLAIRGSHLTDQGLQRLAELPRLEELDVQYSAGALGAEGVRQFQEKKPGCKVLFGPPPEELFPFPPNDTDRVPRGSLPWASVSHPRAWLQFAYLPPVHDPIDRRAPRG